MIMISRRRFGLAAGALLAGSAIFPTQAQSAPAYSGPNVVICRFGGGVRRAETIGEATYAPFLKHKLVPRGVLIPDMRIAQLDGLATSHAEGTINIITGRYLAYRDRGSGFLSDMLEPTRPTLFEYLQRAFAVEPHHALLINGEDRPQEEFLVNAVPGHGGLNVKSEMLSLHRFKTFKFSRIIAEAKGTDEEIAAAQKELDALMARTPEEARGAQSKAINAFWESWRKDYGDTGFVNPRGDRLLTELAVRAMKQLRPKLMMINFQDTDYVHWGNPSHYTRAISIIDQGIERIVDVADNDPFYRENTVFIIVPDCGRDTNSLVDIPFQHHFNTRSAHEIWAVIAGPRVPRGRVLDKTIDQSAIAATVGALMGFSASEAEGSALSEIIT
jgi:hypothetical protein